MLIAYCYEVIYDQRLLYRVVSSGTIHPCSKATESRLPDHGSLLAYIESYHLPWQQVISIHLYKGAKLFS